MPIKGIFAGNDKHDDIHQRIQNLEKEIKRINSLDVTMKRFLNIEGKLHALMLEQNKPISRPAHSDSMRDRNNLQPDIFKQVKDLVAHEMNQHLKKGDNHHKKVQAIQNELADLKETVFKQQTQIEAVLKQMKSIKNNEGNPQEENEKQVVYQEITIERMMIDKYEMNNNIPQLGVKELSGFLNIGATYGRGVIPDELAEDFKKGMEGFKKEKQSKEDECDENSEEQPPREKEEFTEINIDD
jgi:acid stress-induced BolA-like protein IbaG/YrbA